MSRILITGSSSGLGAELKRHLSQAHTVIGYDIDNGLNVAEANDIHMVPELDVLINCAGINDIGWLEDFTEDRWDKLMDVNAKGIYMMSRACLPALTASKGTILNIVSNASHMPMTCSLAYNASKAAAHMMTQQLARELKRHDITVFGVSPNKMAGTGMSRDIERQVVETRGWSEEQAKEYQLASLLTGQETPPEQVADFIAYLLQDKAHHKYLTGCVMPYGA
jgi:NAD(P)-dependent dehydrogenase (short-subunit alcohol dehydrogenase family)